MAIDRDVFARRIVGKAISFAPAPAPDPPEEAAEISRFGFASFLPELLKHRRIWLDVLIASLVLQLLALTTPVLTQVIVDKVVVHQTYNTLIVIAAALLMGMLFNSILSFARQYLVLHTGTRIDAVLTSNVFDHLLKLPLRYFERRPTGVVIARLQAIETIRQFITGAAITLLLDCPFMLVFLAIMLWYSGLLTLVTSAVLLLIVALSIAVAPVLRGRLNRQFLLGARNQAFLTEYVSAMETVKSLQMEAQLRKRFDAYLAAYLQAGFSTRQLANTYSTIANACEQLLTVSVLCLGAWLVMKNDGFTVGMLVAFQMFSGRLAQPLLRIVGLWQEFQQAAIAVKRLGDVMDAPQEPYCLAPNREGIARGRIEIRNLSFRHADNLPYLYRHMDLTVGSGQCVAIMGPSGCGKSTFAKLLQGFYPPSDGAIALDGNDIRYYSANELRAVFGVVPQETVLFSGTVYENVLLGHAHASLEDVIMACKAAGIHDTIEQLPQGYQTPLGEHGVGLSGGQKQRIAIARALLKRPKVLIFDEATSNLDRDTAAAFGRTIAALKGVVTILLIAHELPPGVQPDAIVDLGTGARKGG